MLLPAHWQSNPPRSASRKASSSYFYGGPRGSTFSMSSPGRTGGDGPSSPQQQTRLQEFLSKIPLGTTLITLLCLILQLCAVLLGWDLNKYTINPAAVVYGHEYYRLVTGAYFHSGVLHIVMNMLAFMGLGAWLEFKVGTAYFVWTIWVSTLLTNTLYIGICFFLATVTKREQWLYYSSIGFSGVIFTLAVLESYSSPPGSTRSIFGMCNVPARVYPWVLLIFIQLVMPHISFVGHLSGLLVGILQAYGCLGVLFPSADFLNRLESSRVLSWFTRYQQYVLCPEAASHALPETLSLQRCFSRLTGGSGSPRRFVGSGVSGTVTGNAAASSSSSSGLPTTVQPPQQQRPAPPRPSPTAAVPSPTRPGGQGAGGWSRLSESGSAPPGFGGDEEVEIVYDDTDDSQRRIVL